jgi:hypothetical protein
MVERKVQNLHNKWRYMAVRTYNRNFAATSQLELPPTPTTATRCSMMQLLSTRPQSRASSPSATTRHDSQTFSEGSGLEGGRGSGSGTDTARRVHPLCRLLSPQRDCQPTVSPEDTYDDTYKDTHQDTYKDTYKHTSPAHSPRRALFSSRIGRSGSKTKWQEGRFMSEAASAPRAVTTPATTRTTTRTTAAATTTTTTTTGTPESVGQGLTSPLERRGGLERQVDQLMSVTYL